MEFRGNAEIGMGINRGGVVLGDEVDGIRHVKYRAEGMFYGIIGKTTGGEISINLGYVGTLQREW